jgi:hypothetical protein
MHPAGTAPFIPNVRVVPACPTSNPRIGVNVGIQHTQPKKQFLERSCKRSQKIYDMCKAGSTRVRTELSISEQRPGGR